MRRRHAHPRRGRGAMLVLLLLMGLGVLVLPFAASWLSGALQPPPSPPPPPAPTFPAIPLDRLEPVVRTQFETALDAIEADPTDASAYGAVGMLCLAYELDAVAIPYCEYASTLDPDAFDWAYDLGLAHQRLGDVDAAQNAFETAGAIRPASSFVTQRLGELDLERGDADRAADRLWRVIGARPNSARAYETLGRAELMRSDPSAAFDAFDRALEIAPEFGAAHYGRARAARQLDRPESATMSFAQADSFRETAPPPEDPREIAIDTLKTGGVESLHAGIDRLQAGDVDGALPLLEQAVALSPHLAEAHSQLGAALLMADRVEAAATRLDAALAVDPGFVDALYNRGVAARRLGAHADAAMFFERTIAGRPDHLDAQLGLGSARLQVGDAAGAVEPLQIVVRERPDDVRAWRSLGRALAGAGRHADAASTLRAALGRFPTDGVLRQRLAWVLATRPDPAEEDAAEALALATQAVQATQGRNPIVLDTYAAALAANERFEDAVRAAERAATLAEQGGRPDLASEYAGRATRYRAGEPYRED